MGSRNMYRPRIGVLASALALCSACSHSPVVGAMEPTGPAGTLGTAAGSEGEVGVLYGGSAEAPIAGLLLQRKPTPQKPVAFFDDPTGKVQELDTQVRLAGGESVAFSRHRDRAVRSHVEDGKTIFTLDERPVSVPGRAGLALDSDGRTSVAWTLPNEESEEKGQLYAYGPGGEPLFQQPIEGLDWLDVAAHGERILLGARGETLVLDRKGEKVARLPGAKRGAVSPDGAWVALERAGERGRLFTLARLGGKSAEFEVKDEAVALEFNAAGSGVARATAQVLQTYHLDGDRPSIESERRPPDGFTWRSAAFADDGRLGAGRILVVARPERHPPKPPGPETPDTPGQAWLGVDVFLDARGEPKSVVWEVADWNHRAPEVVFDAKAAFAIAWPSAFEVKQ